MTVSLTNNPYFIMSAERSIIHKTEVQTFTNTLTTERDATQPAHTITQHAHTTPRPAAELVFACWDLMRLILS